MDLKVKHPESEVKMWQKIKCLIKEQTSDAADILPKAAELAQLAQTHLSDSPGSLFNRGFSNTPLWESVWRFLPRVGTPLKATPQG